MTKSNLTSTGKMEFEETYFFFLSENDLCLLLTLDGSLVRIWYHSEENFYRNADYVHELMADVLGKDNENAPGCWVWKIKDKELGMEANYIGGIDEN